MFVSHLPRHLVALVLTISAIPAAPSHAQSLISPDIRVDFTTGSGAFGFTVTDQATHATLLSQSSLSFGGASVTGVQSYTADASHILLNLQLTGGGSATAAFTLTDPRVLNVQLTGSGANVSQYFNDIAGQAYYGIQSKTYGKNLNNRGLTNAYYGSFASTDGVSSEGARAPFYMTSNHVGIYAQTVAQGEYKLGVSGQQGFTFNSSSLQYNIIAGTDYKDTLGKFNALAGPACMPPTWAFDSIWWRDDNHQIPSADASTGVSSAQQLVLRDAARLQQYHIPASAIMIDRPFGTGNGGLPGWGNFDFDASFPNPAQMVADLDAKGMNVMVWIANRLNNTQLSAAQNSAGAYDYFPGYTSTPAADVRDPATAAWFQSKLDAFVNLGVKGYKIDRGGEGEMPNAVNNDLVTQFQKLAYQSMQQQIGSDYFAVARDVNDTGRQYTAVWNGDSNTTFAGLSTSVKNGLRAGILGFAMWGSDTGGYLGAKPTKELLARWMGFSAYCPVMEIVQNSDRNVWYNYDQQLIDITVKQTQAHHDLIPYVRSAMYQNTRTGAPVMRAMFLEFPDANLADVWDQYMYGDHLLVAPVVQAGVNSRTVYLPAGSRWLDFNNKLTADTCDGGRTLTVSASLDTVPVFVREGAIVPHGDILQSNQAAWIDNWQPHLTIDVFPSDAFPAGAFDYYTGDDVQAILWQLSGSSLRIRFGQLDAAGDIDIYLGRFFDFQGLLGVRLNGLSLDEGAGYTFDSDTLLLRIPFDSAVDLSIVMVPEPTAIVPCLALLTVWMGRAGRNARRT